MQPPSAKTCPSCQRTLQDWIARCPQCNHDFGPDVPAPLMDNKFLLKAGVGFCFAGAFVIYALTQKPVTPVPASAPVAVSTLQNTLSLKPAPIVASVAKAISAETQKRAKRAASNPYAHYDPSKPWRKQGFPGMSSVADERAAFEIILIQAGLWKKVITSVGQGTSDDDVKITLADGWHFMPADIRLQSAQKLWKLWASVHSPDNVDASSISLIDQSGNSVGGSTIGMGSVIRVERE